MTVPYVVHDVSVLCHGRGDRRRPVTSWRATRSTTNAPARRPTGAACTTIARSRTQAAAPPQQPVLHATSPRSHVS